MACASVASGILLFLLALGEQFGDSDAQGLGQEKCFLVGDASDACLYLGQGATADVQTLTLASGGQVFLREVESVSQPADLFSYDVRGQVVLHFWSLTLEHSRCVIAPLMEQPSEALNAFREGP